MYELKDSIGYKFNLVATTLKTNFTKLLQPSLGIAAEQFGTLKIISDDSEITQTRIAELLGKDKTTVGRSIESLIKKGMLNKKYESCDKRVNKISLTPKGEEILQKALPIAQKFNENIKKHLSQEEINIFFKITDIILQETKEINTEKEENI